MNSHYYSYDNRGRRRLIGLTVEETEEFERLDRIAPIDETGRHWRWLTMPATEARWLELFEKHEAACKARTRPR